MNRKQHTDLMILSGHSYNNGSFELPENWQEITSYSAENGFQGTVYKNGNEITISYRGSDTAIDFFGSDRQMYFEQIPGQYQNAKEVYKQVKQIYPNSNITVTGHSLGGSLAQLVSAENDCQAVTFNAYGTGEILTRAGYKNIENLNIINYGNPKDPVFSANFNQQPGKNFVTNTDLAPDKIYEGIQKYDPHIPAHKIEQMGPLEDAVEVKPTTTEYNSVGPFQLYAEKTDFAPFSLNQIAQMSDEDFIKNEPQIMQQLRNRQFKEQKTDFSKYTNPLTGSKKIYTKEELEKMTLEEFTEKESEIMAQLQTIGLPAKNDLPQKHFSTNSSDGKWVTINGNHVFIEK